MAQSRARRRPGCHNALFVIPICPAMTTGAIAEIGKSRFILNRWTASAAMRLPPWNSREEYARKDPVPSSPTDSGHPVERKALDQGDLGARPVWRKGGSQKKRNPGRDAAPPSHGFLPGSERRSECVCCEAVPLSTIYFWECFPSSRMIVSRDEAGMGVAANLPRFAPLKGTVNPWEGGREPTRGSLPPSQPCGLPFPQCREGSQ
jgi:hypothetical protein